ncbi:hypothetical protein HA402_012044 [Bradysia odoriphaga]|nr:hypothetical protein HA402_012044 [Bradysia odoriphaga]
MITGASSGIGRYIAVSVAKLGAKVILIGRNKERLQQTMDQLPNDGHSFYAVDLTDLEKLQDVISEIGSINGLVNSAGILALSPLKILTPRQMDQITQINYNAPVHLTRMLINSKKIESNASVVFITSVNGVFTAVKGFGAYAGAKAALNSICKVFALEYASRRIRFNTIAPGMIKTEMYAEMVKTVSEENVALDKQKYPLGDYGDPEDVSNAAVYLLSDASKWVTGTSLIVDGGLTIV